MLRLFTGCIKPAGFLGRQKQGYDVSVSAGLLKRTMDMGQRDQGGEEIT